MDNLFTFFFLVSLIFGYIDYNDVIYHNIFKLVLLFTDLCLLISTLVDLLNKQFLENSFDTLQESLLLGVNIISSYIILYLWKEEYQILYSMNPFSGNHSDYELLEYFLKLDYLCDSKDRF